MILYSIKKLINLLMGVLLLCIVSGCQRPYAQFRPPSSTKTFQEKRHLVRTLEKKKLTKRMKDMSLAESLEAKLYYEDLGRYEIILRLIPHIISLLDDVQHIAQLHLELADLHLGMGDLEEAQKHYTTFIAQYPGDPHIKAARYRLLLTTFWNALEPDREQVLTLTCIDLAKAYLQDFPDDTEYYSKVHEILKTCYQSLFVADLSLVKFYLHKFTYEHKPSSVEAARMRLEHLKQAYLPIIGIYDERVKDILPALEALEKMEKVDAAFALDLIPAIQKQIDSLTILLLPPHQKYRVHPRDIF